MPKADPDQSTTKKRLHCVICGKVQGVAFRYYTRNKAQQLSLTGWVRNNPDGSVEVCAEGSESSLDLLEQWLHEGPPYADVKKVHTFRENAKGVFDGFSITA